MVNFNALISALGIIAISHLLHHGFKEATMTSMDLSKPKGTVKTIKGDNGDIIDCVNIYKQTAFNNQLIKSLQLNLNLDKLQMKRDKSLPNNKLVQDWHRNGECPFQTVPILRSLRPQTSSFQPLTAMKSVQIKNHEHAMVWNKKGVYYGASAKFSVSNPHTEDNDFSLTQLWLVTEPGTSNLNSIEAGWIVHLHMFGDRKTRFFVYWTRDRYNNTGCYNLKCPGFVQTSRTFAVGSPLDNESEIHITIFKEDRFGDWYLKLDNEIIGYWPVHLFRRLDANASQVSWGGSVYSKPSRSHTTTHMGNGQFPGKGYTKASHVRNLQVMTRSNNWISPDWSLDKIITKPNCYNLQFPNIFTMKSDWGVYFRYGGRGFSSKCP